jgi:hypothetical protein
MVTPVQNFLPTKLCNPEVCNGFMAALCNSIVVLWGIDLKYHAAAIADTRLIWSLSS